MRSTSLGIVVVALAGLAQPAQAQDDPRLEAKIGICTACHGQTGIPQAAGVPVLWGQNEGYIYLQLRDMKTKARLSQPMNAIAATLEKEDMFALAKFFASRPWPNLDQAAASKDLERVAITANISVGCTGCHLENYQGNSTVPRLAGQKKDYLLSSMLAFRDHSRANNPGMSDLMNATSVDDLTAIAAYLAGL